MNIYIFTMKTTHMIFRSNSLIVSVQTFQTNLQAVVNNRNHLGSYLQTPKKGKVLKKTLLVPVPIGQVNNWGSNFPTHIQII